MLSSTVSHTVGRVANGVSLCAPCRNRTYNLMIKSQFGSPSEARTTDPSNDALVPHGCPERLPKFHAISHGSHPTPAVPER